MFQTDIPKTKGEITLKHYDTFEGKITAACEYATVTNVFVEVSNIKDVELKIPVTLNVTQINVPVGSPSYVLGTLKEWSKTFELASLQFIYGDDDFNSITDTLNRCIEKCSQGHDTHNIDNIFTFKQDIKFEVYKDRKWHPTMFQYLGWPDISLYEDFKEHLNIRRGFFSQLIKTLTKAKELHCFRPDLTNSPYKWDSSNPELEISELIYLLCKKAELIKIDTERGGSFAKFKRDFFTLFGLSDKDYEKKVSQVLARKKNNHFVIKLSTLLPKDEAPGPNNT